MQTYLMDVLLRNDNPEGEEGSERIVQCTNIHAESELAARRQVLEKSWARGLLVSEIRNVRTRVDKKH